MSADKSTSETLRYRLPHKVGFVLAVIGMALVTDLAIATGPSASDWARDVAVPARWQAITNLFGGYVNVEACMKAYFTFWASITGGTSAANYYIAIAAWAVHVIETIFAVRKCLRYKASAGVTLSYGVGVFLCGVGQFGNLNREARRVDRVKKEKKQ